MASESFDVVLLYLQLPDGHGLTIFDAWIGKTGAPGVIVVTADGSLNRAITAMRCGAYDFLVKPVAGSRLLATVANAAQQRSEAQPVSQSDAAFMARQIASSSTSALAVIEAASTRFAAELGVEEIAKERQVLAREWPAIEAALVEARGRSGAKTVEARGVLRERLEVIEKRIATTSCSPGTVRGKPMLAFFSFVSLHTVC